MAAIPRLPDLYIPHTPAIPRGSLSRPSASSLEKLGKQQIDVQWSLTAFNKPFRLVYGIQPVAGWFMTRPVVNGAGNLVVAVYWCIGPIQGIDTITINSRPIPVGVTATTYTGDVDGVVDPTLAAALAGSGFADIYDQVAYTVFEIPPATVEGFPQQSQFMARVRGIVSDDNPAPQARYWRVRALEPTGSRSTIGLLNFRATPGGANVATGGTAIASSGTAANAFPPTTAVNEWRSSLADTAPGAWVGYDAGAGNTFAVEEVWMSSGNDNLSEMPKLFVTEYSDDGVAWVIHNTYYVDGTWSGTQSRVFTNTGLASENPGEHLKDFVTNATYGLGSPIDGITEVISFDNDLVGDEVETRCLAGFTIHGARERQVIDMLAEHAECLWSYDGPGIFVVPDTAVDAPVATITESQIEEGSFKINGRGLADSPSSISVTITDRSGDSIQWSQDAVSVQQITDYDVSSVVYMAGVYRASEGRRKGTKRIRRLSAAASFSWVHMDDAIAFQVGDVIRLPDIRGLVDQDTRILSISQPSAGSYSIEGEPYSATYYDGALPVPTVDVPVGGILPYFSNDDVPDGWTLYSDGDGLPIRGDNANAGNDTGVTDIPQLSGTSSTAGNHTGPEFDGAGRIEPSDDIDSHAKKPAGAHSHDYETDGPVEHTMLQVRRRLIEKTGSDGPLPPNAAVFANGQLMSGDMSPVNTFIGRKMAAGATSEQVGDSNTRSIAITSISDAGAHLGHEGLGYGTHIGGLQFGPNVYANVAAPNHNHGGEGSISVTVNPKSRKMAVYVATVETGISLGAVIGFDPALSLPSGWAEFDLEGHLIEISTPQSAGADSGNDTVTWTGTMMPDGKHSHKGELLGNFMGAHSKYHDTNTDHQHSMTGSAAFKPLAHCLRLIQYTGV